MLILFFVAKSVRGVAACIRRFFVPSHNKE